MSGRPWWAYIVPRWLRLRYYVWRINKAPPVTKYRPRG